MPISEQQRADILRYYFVEQWRVGTIATQLGVHHSSVERVISQAGMPKIERARGPSIIDPYLPFIHETLQRFPTLSAARLFQMAQSRGYPGSPSHFRQWIAQLRPRKTPEAYLRVKTLPGEQGQMDWGHFGQVQIARAKRPLMAFVFVLSYSRMMYLQFYYNAQTPNFLDGHINAFAALGVPRVVLYDNLKSAVLQRHGKAVDFNPQLLDLSAHYRFKPQPVAVARGNEKGRVERSIRYIRDNFFAGRVFEDIDTLNEQARHWCTQIAASRPCPGNPDLTVEQMWHSEREHLIPLPELPYDGDDVQTVSVGKTPYVRYDLNDYSIPHTHVRRELTVRASPYQVRIIDAAEVLAVHTRHYGKGEQIEDPRHIDELRQAKQAATGHSQQHRLYQRVAVSERFLSHTVERGHPLSASLKHLTQWLEQYGAVELKIAIEEALQQSCHHTDGVLQILERRREQQQRPVPLAIAISPKAADHPPIKPASLQGYDQLYARSNDSSLNHHNNDTTSGDEQHD